MPHVHGLSSHDGLNFSKKFTPTLPAASEMFKETLQQSLQARTMRPLHPLDMVAPLKGAVMAMQPLNPLPKALKPLGTSPFDLSHAKEPKSQHERLQETARKLVAQTFYGPMLKSMRNSPFKDKLMSGGRGGEAFTSLLDQRLAEHMARGADSKLVRSIARKLEGNAARQPKAPPPETNDQQDNPNKNVRIHVAPGLRA